MNHNKSFGRYKLIILFVTVMAELLLTQPLLRGEEDAILKALNPWGMPDYDKIMALSTEAIRRDPKDAQAFIYRGMAYAARRDYDRAIADYSELIRLKPEDTNAYAFRAQTYNAKGDYDMAIADYNEAIRLDPKSANLYDGRRIAYLSKSDYTNAIADLDEAIRLVPDDASRYETIANLFATCPKDGVRDGKKAVKYAKKACELWDWRNPWALITLAAAYAEAGDFDKAIQSQKKFLKTVTGISEDGIAKARHRLALYQVHKPYRAEK